jgi:energy-coupling factor transporter ATP-binding protein EcfA2
VTDEVVARDLHYAYPHPGGGDEVVPVLRGVDLRIASGEIVVLLGRVGAGKTTLCMALNGLVPHATGGRYRGNVTVLGLNTKQHPVADLARRVGLVFQDPETQLTQMRVEDEIAFGPENLGVPRAEIEERVTWALNAVGLLDCRDRSPLLLSGGQKQRVAIAATLAMRPSLLVLDEPTASLDPSGKLAVLDVLAELARERQVTVFMATQELEWVARFADRVLALHEGRIALDGSPATVFRHARELREWGIGMPQMAELADRLSRRTGHRYRFLDVAEAYRQLRRDVRPEAVPVTTSAAPQTPEINPPPKPDCPTIRVEELSHTYGDGTVALRGVSLELPPGDFVALLGPNGSGKTTLAKHLDGLLQPGAGRVLVGDLDTRTAGVARLARAVGYVFQNPDHQIFSATVEEELAFGPRSQGLPEEVIARRVAEVLDLFGLAPFARTPPASLGFGRRRQVALAAVLAAAPQVLILDEPTGALDARSRGEIMAAVCRFHAGTPPALRAGTSPAPNTAGGTVVLITHDMSLVAEYARRAIVLLDGRVLFDGGVSELLLGRRDLLARAGLGLPPVVRLAKRLTGRGLAAPVLTLTGFVDAWTGPDGSPGGAVAHPGGSELPHYEPGYEPGEVPRHGGSELPHYERGEE